MYVSLFFNAPPPLSCNYLIILFKNFAWFQTKTFIRFRLYILGWIIMFLHINCNPFSHRLDCERVFKEGHYIGLLKVGELSKSAESPEPSEPPPRATRAAPSRAPGADPPWLPGATSTWLSWAATSRASGAASPRAPGAATSWTPGAAPTRESRAKVPS